MNSYTIQPQQTSDPKVSVLMAVYNGERYLREAIESILAQTFTDFEFLIVNDGSTDSSRDIVLSYHDSRIRLIDNPENMGLTKSLNRGLSLARGEYVARQDADDRSHALRLEKQIAFMNVHQDVVLIGTQARIIDENGRTLKSRNSYRAQTYLGILFQFLFENPFIHSSVMFQKKVILEHFRGYDESLYYNQDFHLWSSLLPSFFALNVPEPLIDLRRNPFSITQLTPSKKEAFKQNLYKGVLKHKANITIILGSDSDYIDFPAIYYRINDPFIDGHHPQAYKAINRVLVMYNKFKIKYPESDDNTELRKILINVLDNILQYLALYNKKAALRSYISLLFISRGSILTSSPKIFGLIFFNKSRIIRIFIDRLRRISSRCEFLFHWTTNGKD